MSGEWSEGEEYCMISLGEKAEKDDKKYGKIMREIGEQIYDLWHYYSLMMSGDYGDDEDWKRKVRVKIVKLEDRLNELFHELV